MKLEETPRRHKQY